MEYVNENFLSVSPSVISKRQKYRDAFKRHQKNQIEKINKAHLKLDRLKFIYNNIVSNIDTLKLEIEKNERDSEEREMKINKYIFFLSQYNTRLERVMYNKYGKQ